MSELVPLVAEAEWESAFSFSGIAAIYFQKPNTLPSLVVPKAFEVKVDQAIKEISIELDKIELVKKPLKSHEEPVRDESIYI